jgi:hypothetical protein
MRSMDIFSVLNPSSCVRALGINQHLTVIFLGSRARPVRKTDNLTVICEQIVYKIWEPRRLTTL